MKILIKCQAKECQVKIIIHVKKIIIDGKEQFEPKEMLNFCPRHQDKFIIKIEEIKNYYSKKELENILIKNIATNIVENIDKKNKTPL